MLALLDLFRNVWKKAAIPICDKHHPKLTISSRTVEVFVKNGDTKINDPHKKNTKFVIMHKIRLKIKNVNQ